eukprot:TRINITY_DN472_c0_g12_i1.p1 TRINITY_DN472_c0_g12~~TRINITY_DN472_c0_g12_i1.p1  ORF type:complete len:383 (+),score=59.38 TRINITY_DN472_c0_g12_i1:368-1516(+)
MQTFRPHVLLELLSIVSPPASPFAHLKSSTFRSAQALNTFSSCYLPTRAPSWCAFSTTPIPATALSQIRAFQVFAISGPHLPAGSMADHSSAPPATNSPSTMADASAWSTTSVQFGAESMKRVVREVSEKVLSLSEFKALCEREQNPQVLDIASGTGSATFAAAEVVGKTRGKVVGTDFAEGMIKLLQARVESEGWPNVESRVMDAEKLEFPDASFHCLTCQFGLMFFPNPGAAMSEMARVLKPLGQCCITTWKENQLMEELLQAAAELQPDNPPDFTGLPPLNFSDPKKLSDDLLKAGFASCRTHEFAVEMSFKDADEFWSILASNPGVTTLLGMLREEVRGRLGEVVVRRLKEEYGEGKGPLVLDRCAVLVAVANKGETA